MQDVGRTVGRSLWHQVAPVELSPAGGVAAITSSNALRLTIGVF